MKFRHLVDRTETLIGYGPVGPHEVINTSLDLRNSPNFELIDEPVGGGSWSAPEPIDVVDEPKKISKKDAEPPVDAAPVEG